MIDRDIEAVISQHDEVLHNYESGEAGISEESFRLHGEMDLSEDPEQE